STIPTGSSSASSDGISLSTLGHSDNPQKTTATCSTQGESLMRTTGSASSSYVSRPEAPARRPVRQRKPPDRYGDWIMS
ncbi:hypothetical protein ScPMuIL_004694, partial [Solemya velum]